MVATRRAVSYVLAALTNPFTDADASYALLEGFAYAFTCVCVAAIVFQAALRRPGFLKSFEPDLWSMLKDPVQARRAGRNLTIVLVLGAAVLSANYFARVTHSGSYLHRWDAFHTVMGAKYHDELGYFDTYKCALAIDRENNRHFRAVERVRNLRTRKHVDVVDHLEENDCKSRFSPERLAEFERDIDVFGRSMSSNTWKRLFTDKGFNGTPFYTVVVRGLLSVSGQSIEQLTNLALLDPLLMLAAFGFVGWAFGVRRAALFALFFCSFFPNRYLHMGGSILRFDYVAATTMALCLLHKGRWATCGALLAWATMVRVFPLLFAGAIVLKMAVEIFDTRKLGQQHIRFALAYGGGVALLFAVSLVGLDGALGDWSDWWTNMQVHNHKSASFRIGFKHLFMLDGSLENVSYSKMQAKFESRRLGYYFAVGLLLLPLLLSIRRLSATTFAALFGVVSFFLLVVSTRYYYSIIAVYLLVDRDVLSNKTLATASALLVGASAFDFFYFATFDNTPLMYNFILGAQMTLFVLVIAYGLLFDPGLEDGCTAPVDAPAPRPEQDLGSGEAVGEAALSSGDQGEAGEVAPTETGEEVDGTEAKADPERDESPEPPSSAG